MVGAGASNASHLLDREAAAAFLGISVRKLDEEVKHGRIPSFKLGRLRRFCPETLRRWIQGMHQEGGAG